MTPTPTPTPTKKPTPTPSHVGYATVWIPVQLKERIDSALAARSRRAGAGLRPSRQAFVAEILSAHLDEMERDAAQP